MVRDADAIPRAKPRGVQLGPIRSPRCGVIEVRMCVDQRLAGASERLGLGASRRHCCDSSSSKSTNAALAAVSTSWMASSSCATAA